MAFDPNESRNLRGEWTSFGGGATHTAPGMPFVSVSSPANAEKAKAIAEQAAVVAQKLGYNPHDINVSDESKTFELNGKTMYYAGAAHYPPPQGENTTPVRGTITLYTPHINNNEEVPGLTAHEIMHQKFQAFINDYRDDFDKMQKDPDYLRTTAPDARIGAVDDFMLPDGTLKAPYDARYPAYTAYTKALAPDASDFAKTDGVSSYSRDWWDAWHASTANTAQAMHETLAEIARHRLTKEPITHIMRHDAKVGDEKVSLLKTRKGIDPAWNALYNAVEAHWKRRNK